MRTRMLFREIRLALVCLACLAMLGVLPKPAEDLVETINIESNFGGLPGDFRQSETRITRNGDGYVSAGHVVDSAKVAALVSALERDSRPAPLLGDFGLDSSWLRANANRAFAQYINNGRGDADQGFFTPKQRALYLSSFENWGVVSRALRHYYESANMALDYSPEITVIVRKASGATITAHSDRQTTLMLPWSITIQGQTKISVDPAISDAIYSLMQNNDPNYVRLSRATLIHELPMLVGDEITPAWNKLPAFDTKPLVSALEKRYRVHISHGASTMTSDALLAWNAHLWWDDSPPNVGAIVTLPIINNTIRNTEAIPAARKFMLAATHIPWIQRVINGDPYRGIKLSILIENENGTTISGETQNKFLADMKQIGRDDCSGPSAASSRSV